MRARALLGRDDRTWQLICPPGSTRRVLDLVGIGELVALYASRDELVCALCAFSRGRLSGGPAVGGGRVLSADTASDSASSV